MPAVFVRVAIAGHGFTGSNPEVAFERAELARFIANLEIVERDRRGTANLTSMSPNEFSLTIAIIDRLGHVLLTCELMRYVYATDSTSPHRVAVSFALDQTTLPGMLSDFKELLAFQHPLS